MSYIAARNLNDALDALNSGQMSVIAGGTDWYPALGDRPVPANTLDISRIDALRGINRTRTGWRIGATTRWADLFSQDLPAAFDGLKAAAREVGSIQIQNAGTLAGNLCNASPAADGVPPLLCLEAQVELTSRQGTRHLPLSTFLKGVRQTDLKPGELLTAIHLPDPGARRSSFLKLGARRYLVISIAMVSVTLLLDRGRIAQARVAVGACSPVALRLTKLEEALVGCGLQDLTPILIKPAHLDDLSPIDDIRGSAAYRKDAVATLILRALKAAL